MARKRRKKHYSRAARIAHREKIEREKNLRKREVKCGDRTPFANGTKTKQSFASRKSNPDFLIEDTCESLSESDCERYNALLVAILKHRPGLVDHPYVTGVRLLLHGAWLREPDSWQPRGRGLSAAFHSLAAHLLGEYPISPYLWDTLLLPGFWCNHERETLRFVQKVARGFSVRRMVGSKLLPPPLTRRMVYILTHPPRPLEYVAMVRRAQVLGYGGYESLARVLADSCQLDSFRTDEEYWASVIHWFCRQKAAKKEDIEMILDYLDVRYREGEVAHLKGRTLHSLRRDARRWRQESENRRRLRRPVKTPTDDVADIVRRPVGIDRFAAGDWRIAEIRTARRLILEGNLMRHCVGSYGDDLKSGESSFWSLTRNEKRMLTIEVCNKQRKVATVAGKANRQPKPEEVNVLSAWAHANGLAMGGWEPIRA